MPAPMTVRTLFSRRCLLAHSAGSAAVVGAGPQRSVSVALVLAIAVSCTPPRGAAGLPQELLYVVNNLDGTVTAVDIGRGRPHGDPAPAGPMPWAVAPGPPGSFLVWSSSPTRYGDLTLVSLINGTWAARPMSVRPQTRTIRVASGGQWALVISHDLPSTATPAPRDSVQCTISLIDVGAGAVQSARPLACSPRDVLTSVAFDAALQAGSGVLTAYLGLWTPDSPGTGLGESGGGGRDRLVAVSVETGAVVGGVPLAGAPTLLTIEPAPGRLGQRLYVVEAVPDHDTYDGWRLVGRSLADLHSESEIRLPEGVLALKVTPDGERAYALAPRSPAPPPARITSRVLDLDLTTGTVSTLVALPGRGLDLAMASERLYIPHAEGNEVWVVDRRRGILLRPVRVGRYPVSLALASSSR